MSTVKTALSIEERLYTQAEDVAKKMHISRSRLYSMALETFLERRDALDFVRSYNQAYSEGLNDDERATLAEAEDAHWAAAEPEQW